MTRATLGMVGAAGIAEQLESAGVDLFHYFGGGAYIKQSDIPRGAKLTQHKHEHDHLSYLVRGLVILKIDDGKGRVLAGPCCIKLDAGRAHEVEALADSIWLCVWATDCTDPDTVDQVLAGPG